MISVEYKKPTLAQFEQKTEEICYCLSTESIEEEQRKLKKKQPSKQNKKTKGGETRMFGLL